MATILFWLAAATALAAFAVHTFVGGARVARPLLADRTLPPASKWLNYYCWHMATITLVIVAAAFAYAAPRPGELALASFATVFAGSAAVLSAAVALKARIHPLRFPSTSLLALVAALGAAGILLR